MQDDALQGRLSRQFQGNLDYCLHVCGGQVEFAPALLQLLVQFLYLLFQPALELQQAAQGSSFLFSSSGIEPPPAPQHGLFHLLGDDRADLAEVLADRFYLVHGTHQEFQVGIQFANGQILPGIWALAVGTAHEVIDVYFGGALAVAINTPVALLKPVGVPGNFVVDEASAVVLQVYPLGGGVRGEQDAHLCVPGIGLEGGLDGLALFGAHAAVQRQQASGRCQPLAFQQIVQPLLGGTVFGKDNHAPARPHAARFDRLVQPGNEPGRLAIGAHTRAGGPGAHLCEQVPFLRGRLAEKRRGGFQGGNAGFFKRLVVVGFFFGLFHLATQDAHTALEGRSLAPPGIGERVLVLFERRGECLRR